MPSASTTPFLASPPFMGNHVPFQHLTLSAGASSPSWSLSSPALVGVDQVQIAMAGSSGLIREAVDLSPHPQLAITRKRRGQGILDLVVESTDRENAGAASILRWIIRPPARRGLRVEKLVRVAGHYGHPTEEVCGTLTSLEMADWWGR